MFISLCDFEFIMRHFKFMKTVFGKGVFNLFCACMFLVGNGDGWWGWAMMGTLTACGLFFILVSCACIRVKDKKDLTNSKLKDTDSSKQSLVDNKA